MSVVYDFKLLRPSANYPVYPPYHTGNYLEEYFYNFYLKNKNTFDQTGYTLIPVFWTNCYITNNNRHLLQPFLNALPPGKYFTVSQHDDAIEEQLPPGTIKFEAGGNKNGIPIPLICSSIPKQHCTETNKDIFCSFVGSNSAPLRNTIYNLFKDDKEIFFSVQQWQQQVSTNRFEEFINITKRSHFTLCPRGYGAQSFRLYEALQLNSIPVFIYDKEWFPFSDKINWKDFCVLVHVNELTNLKSILKGINIDTQQQMIECGKQMYNKFFTLEAVCKNILAHLVAQTN